jgi:XTP/dITP diphosphohydrolase
MKAGGILETVLYAEDLDAAQQFYEGVVGLQCFARHGDRDRFFRCGDQVLLIFNPHRTSGRGPAAPGVPPPHGAFGQGHVCFRAEAAAIDAWRQQFEARGIGIDADFSWPSGGRSLYVRDPAGNSVEFAEPRIWGLPGNRRSLSGERIVIATHNAGKREEFACLLTPLGALVSAASDLGLTEPEETETSFAGNARIKAESAVASTGLVALADDSGLCVEALDGAPGVFTANWAGPQRDWSMAMRLVEEKLQARKAMTPEQRRAAFVCVLCVAWPDGEVRLYEGRTEGHLVWPLRGKLGHGYDPMFVPEGQSQTFAEMDPEQKNRISHRARAIGKLLDDLG